MKEEGGDGFVPGSPAQAQRPCSHGVNQGQRWRVNTSPCGRHPGKHAHLSCQRGLPEGSYSPSGWKVIFCGRKSGK